MKRRSLSAWFLASLVSVPLGLWAAVTFVYCAWLTATPLTPERFRFVQREAIFWLLVTIACLVICGITLARWIAGLLRDRRRSGQIAKKEPNQRLRSSSQVESGSEVEGDGEG